MILNREKKFKSNRFTIDELTYKTKSGTEVKRQVISRYNAVAGIVFDTSKKMFIFVNQWRPGANSDLLEIVAGTLDVIGEETRDAMKREIMEEIGYEVDNIKLIDECYASPGLSTEVISIYYIEVSKKVADGGGHAHEHEEIDIIEMDYDEMISTVFRDAKTIIAINWVKANKKN